MRPNFALSLSFSGIQLLQRQESGWGRVGDVDISSADLTGELVALRDKAVALGSGPVQTKLIIPDDQIKYLTVDAAGLDKDALQTAVLHALDGATPYPVDDLEFDFANENGSVHIAAVAKETLQEAENFASEHGFEPIGFVAAPTQGNFPKEPTFGLSAYARSKGIMALDADAHPAIATGEAIAVVQVAKPVEQTPEDLSIPVAGFSSRRTAPESETKASDASQPKPVTPVVSPAPEASVPLGGADRNIELAPAPKAPAPIPAKTAPTGPTPQITGVSDAAIDENALDGKLSGLRPGAAFDDDGFEDDIPPMPASFAAAPRTGAAMRGAADGAPIADLRAPNTAQLEPIASEPNALKENGAKVAAKALAIAGTAGGAALSGARSFMAKQRAKKAEAKVAPVVEPEVAAAEASVEDEKQRMTVFGARKPKKKKEPIAIGGKPRFLGLILTAVLLLFLVSVAAWASVFLDDGLARFFGGQDRDKAIAELPNPDPSLEPNAEELIELASLDTGESDILSDDLPLAQEGLAQVAPEPAPAVITPEEAEATYAATGIWLATPEMPLLPPKIALEDVYTASIDARITGQDAFAMEPLSQPRDVAPSIAAAPTTASGNSDFNFDQNGLVIATPEGAITPEGALVFLGRPARVPPAIPERLRTAALTPETAEPTETLDNGTIASLRPKTRPETLVEDTERSQLGGVSRAELAKIRPKLRPKVEKEVEEAEAAQTPATRLAVATSRKPAPRPRNFARLVDRAQKQAERESEQQETRVAAVAPRTVKPSIPSSASVAKNATVRNAINLSRVNLIGVYGKPSSRRALVRLSSGRYKKVKVGDRVDGGRVSAIGEGQLIYTKRGRNVTLRMPKG
ncbi:hypothetical protein [Planktotalea sp.]|uniref:hypothetical protein n=1 Tax=Planktotalea sp. TaxID=2029877 RepID=UPI003F6A7D3E